MTPKTPRMRHPVRAEKQKQQDWAYFILLLVTFVQSEIEAVDDSNSMFTSVEKGSERL